MILGIVMKRFGWFMHDKASREEERKKKAKKMKKYALVKMSQASHVLCIDVFFNNYHTKRSTYLRVCMLNGDGGSDDRTHGNSCWNSLEVRLQLL